jgi:penicillin-binding protein 2
MVWISDRSDHAIRHARARWLGVISLGAITVCFLRMVDLQLLRGRALEQASESNRTQVVVEHAPRGRILDRRGEVLADDRPVFVALFSPLGLRPGDFQQVLARLAPIVGVEQTELEQRLMAAVRARSMLRISDRLTREQAFAVLQNRMHLPGVSLTIEEQRYYPQGILASHVLGYVGQITDEELDQFAGKGYRPGDWIGKSGLERLYDPVLQGQDGGFLIEVDALGRQVRIIRHLPSQSGKDLVLTLDSRLEALAEQRLRESGHPGAAVVIKPGTGELLALASSPGFDPNLFLPLGSSEKREDLLNDPDLPLYNRAIQALYPPGSTFKIITSLAGLEGHEINPPASLHCTGSYQLGSRVFHCWLKKGHGWVNFHEAVAKSCDIYFYQVGTRIGPERIEDYAKLFGLGARSGIDLPSEKKGLLPMAWKQTLSSASERHWQGGDTFNYAIGQGALQVTPLQMTQVIADVATRGVVWQPYLASESRYFSEPPEILGSPHMLTHIPISDSSWDLLQSALTEAVRTGTGVAAQIPSLEIGGKTGTAEATKGKEHSWFVAYAPADHPQVACAVVVEHGGHGAVVAAPIAHDLLAMALGINEKEIPKPTAEVSGD